MYSDSETGAISTVGAHLATLHRQSQQDALFILGDSHESLVKELAEVEPTTFTSNYPIFLPSEYSDLLKLRFDSNIIFYEEKAGHVELIDKFAVKGGPPIQVKLGTWDRLRGFQFESEKHRWNRRKDLGGAELTQGVFFSLYAKFVRDSEGNVTGSKGFYKDVLLSITESLNMTIVTAEIPSDPNWRRLDNGSWTGGIGWLQRKDVDVVGGVSRTLDRTSVIDYPIRIISFKITLVSAIPKAELYNIPILKRFHTFFIFNRSALKRLKSNFRRILYKNRFSWKTDSRRIFPREYDLPRLLS